MAWSVLARVSEGAGGEAVESFAALGFLAFTTGRAAGSFGTQTEEPVRDAA